MPAYHSSDNAARKWARNLRSRGQNGSSDAECTVLSPGPSYWPCVLARVVRARSGLARRAVLPCARGALGPRLHNRAHTLPKKMRKEKRPHSKRETRCSLWTLNCIRERTNQRADRSKRLRNLPLLPPEPSRVGYQPAEESPQVEPYSLSRICAVPSAERKYAPRRVLRPSQRTNSSCLPAEK